MSELENQENKTTASSKSVKKKLPKEVDPIAKMVKDRYATGLFNINQLAAQFMVHTSRIEKILGK